jgi:hypothetical protein
MPYDVEMIRDFVKQLIWNLREDHFKFTAGPDALNPELPEQVKACFERRCVLRLLALFGVVPDRPGMTDDQMREAKRLFAAHMAEFRAEQLRHLEALSGLLDEACVHAAGRLISVAVPASQVLDGTWFPYPEPRDSPDGPD